MTMIDKETQKRPAKISGLLLYYYSEYFISLVNKSETRPYTRIILELLRKNMQKIKSIFRGLKNTIKLFMHK